MNILGLREKIREFLLTKADRVYYERAKSTTLFPYVVFNLVDSRELEGNREDFDLEIDIWDNAQDSTIIETLVGNIDGNGNISNPTGLHRKLIYTYINDDILSAKFYRERRLNIIDEDVRIIRRQLRYVVQTYLDGVWILKDGTWNDDGSWFDSATWNDS